MAACKSLATGLRHRVVLQSLAREPDGQGGFEDAWSDIVALWAGIEPLKGWERMQAMQLQTPATHRVLLRFRKGITTGMRLIYDGRAFDIKEVVNIDEASRYLRLTCVETPGLVQANAWQNLGNTWDSNDTPWGPPAGWDDNGTNIDAINSNWESLS